MRAPWLTLAVWTAFVGCREPEPGPLAEASLLRLECDQLMVGLEHYLAAEGVRRARVVADTACFLEDRSTVGLKHVRVTFYDAVGAASSTLTSDSASYDWLSGDMQAVGDVVVVDAETRRRVETEVMYYERVKEEIWSDRPTTMREPDGTVVNGSGFRSTSGLDRVEMENARLTQPARAEPATTEPAGAADTVGGGP